MQDLTPEQKAVNIKTNEQAIEEKLDALQVENASEDFLYLRSCEIADSLKESSTERACFVDILQARSSTISLQVIRILLSALCDREVVIDSNSFASFVGEFLKSSDKQLAQGAAACLILCGQFKGVRILKDFLEKEELPHQKLIYGMWDLLGAKILLEKECEIKIDKSALQTIEEKLISVWVMAKDYPAICEQVKDIASILDVHYKPLDRRNA